MIKGKEEKRIDKISRKCSTYTTSKNQTVFTGLQFRVPWGQVSGNFCRFSLFFQILNFFSIPAKRFIFLMTLITSGNK